jgi:methenyltetrahydromethanopterin cyclohydrolase
MAGLGRVEAIDEGGVPIRDLTTSAAGDRAGTVTIRTTTDAPVAACLASQYAGWSISVGDYFAMGSGPMRAAYGGEELYRDIGRTETASRTAGVLESDRLPGPEVIELISRKTRVDPERIILAVAATNSVAGRVQVVARSVETALHKLHMLDFDLERIARGEGTAPLPPPARDSFAALGRVNDAMLYGARVTLSVRGDDRSLEAIGPRVPSSSSKDHGTPFREIFDRYDRDFYRIDPHLFSPAQVTFVNVETGNRHTFGEVAPEVLERSFSD